MNTYDQLIKCHEIQQEFLFEVITTTSLSLFPHYHFIFPPTFSQFLHNYLSTPAGICLLLLQPSGTLFLSLRDSINLEISSFLYFQKT